MGLRKHKQVLTLSLQLYQRVGLLTAEEAEGFRLMYARARTPAEQEQVRAALDHRFHGWKTEQDRFSKVLRDDVLGDDEDEDPPELREALERSRVRFGVG